MTGRRLLFVPDGCDWNPHPLWVPTRLDTANVEVGDEMVVDGRRFRVTAINADGFEFTDAEY